MQALQTQLQTRLPSRIIDGLYLGAKEHAEDADVLAACGCGITHIVNATNNLPHFFAEEKCLDGDAHALRVAAVPRAYCRVPVRDMRAEAIDLFFDSACVFIDAALDDNGQVLVHCMAGRSRSATIVLAYLLKCRGYDLASAFKLVRTQRPSAMPNLGFWRQLEAFEKRVRGEPSETPALYVKAKAMDAKLNREASDSGTGATDGTAGVADVCRRFLLATSAQLGAEAEATVLSRWPADLDGGAAADALADALLATLDGTAEHIRCVPRLLWLLVHQHGVLSLEQAQHALVAGILTQDIDDLEIDIPHVWRHVASICEGCLELGLLSGDVEVAHAQVLQRARAAHSVAAGGAGRLVHGSGKE